MMAISETIREALVSEFWQEEAAPVNNAGLFAEFTLTDGKADEQRNIIQIPLDESRSQAIKDLCNTSDVLVFNFYATALSILLHKYFNIIEIRFISPYDQFERPGNSNRFFLFKCIVDEECSFKEIFSASKELLKRSLENCGPVAQIEKNTGVDTIENLTAFGLLTGGEHIESYQPALLFKVKEEAGVHFLQIDFDAARFDAQLLELFGYNFNKLLEEIVNRLYEPVSELNFLSEIEQRLLKEFNAVEPYFPLDNNVVELIVRQARLHPQNIAIKCRDEETTYLQLDEMSNRLARYLSANFEMKADILFGVMMDRSVTMAVCVLGIWKAGAAYVPMDKSFPDERIRQIVNISRLTALLVNDTVPQEQVSRLQLNIPIVNMDVVAEQVTTFSADRIETNIKSNDLAYVIYTSGSTGEPKGVMIEHFGMMNHIGSKVAEMGINSSSIVAQNAVHTFDISVWQYFAALVTGGTTLIYDNDLVMNPAAFTEKVGEDNICVLELVPSYLVEMLSVLEHRPVDLPSLKILILNAETLMPAMVKRWFSLYPDIPIVNTYGATEASDDTSHYIMHDCPRTATIPVMKKPIQNVEVHIVNEQMQPVPIGMKGEILLAGPGIGRGYLNDQERTAAAFLKGPLHGVTNCQRVYRTGDLGRYLPDGTMEFLGRKDNQVKIRGNRIELGEIEHTLMSITGIEHAAVLADTEKQYLVAYYESPKVFAKEHLQSAMREKLPEYMVPQYYIRMEKLPLTANGKIDRKSLPSPETTETGIAYVQPRDEAERKLVSIWMEVLGREQVGVKDDFFELGGHSLKAMRLIGQIHKVFDVKIALKEIFRTTVLEEQAQLLKQAAKKTFVSIPVAPTQSHYPLSPSQQRMWVLSQLEEGSIAYNMAGVFVFEGELNLPALQYALDELVARHESLRTVFREDETGEIRQIIHAAQEVPTTISYKDLGGHLPQDESVKRFLQHDLVQPFDLVSGLLLRTNLYRLSHGKYVFVYIMHHIIGDGWSMDILIRELSLLYNRYESKATDVLKPLRIQYKDYSVWLQQQLDADALAPHKNYWLQQLSGELPVLELPSDRPRPALKTFNGKQLTRQINPQLVNVIRTIGHEQGATLFMNLLALVNTLLYCYTGQEDIIIGSPVAGREHADLENQIGLYVNTLALRTKFTGMDNYTQLLQGIKEVTLGAYEHQLYPFDVLIDELNLPRDVSRNPLFEVMVVLQNTGGAAEAKEPYLGNMKVSGYETGENVISKFDLLFDFAESGDAMQMRLQYNSDIYSSDSMRRLADHFEQLMAAVASSPSMPISELDYLSTWEKQQLFAFNNTAASFQENKTLVQLFEEQVECSPDKTALIFDERSFAYKELNERSNRLAAYLKEQYNILPDDRVGIKLNRSEWLIISILGVLKSGGTYMPVDPDYPQERISYMLQDSNCKVLIDEDELQRFINEQDRYCVENLPVQNTSADLVYVIYTSGSTGQPKGCMLEHRGIVNRLEWMWNHYNFTVSDVILQKTNFAFDVSVLEIFLPLCFGATMVHCQKEDVGSPQRILGLIEQHKITCTCFVPSMLNAFTAEVFDDEAIEDKLHTLRMVIATGEALPLETAYHWYSRLKIPLHNLYGPTETSIEASYHAVHPGDERMLIGAPLQNTQMYILGPGSQLQPIGIPGEICIGGDGLARGYLNKPELTQEKFASNPFKPGERMYRTGDIGRWTSDGKVEYICRKDQQVKIRGYRVEPGEIEAALRSHSSIAACAVITKEDKGEKELVAYIVNTQELNVMEVRTWLSGKLPAYMVPARYIELQSLPLTGSGKLDRKALPDVAGAGMKTGTDYVAARNKTEQKIVAIWQEVLGRDTIGVKDNFFDIGGNSLRLIKMVRLINRRFHKTIPVIAAFTFPTIVALSEYISSDKAVMEMESEEEMLAGVAIMEGTFGSLNYAGDEN